MVDHRHFFHVCILRLLLRPNNRMQEMTNLGRTRISGVGMRCIFPDRSIAHLCQMSSDCLWLRILNVKITIRRLLRLTLNDLKWVSLWRGLQHGNFGSTLMGNCLESSPRGVVFFIFAPEISMRNTDFDWVHFLNPFCRLWRMFEILNGRRKFCDCFRLSLVLHSVR